MSSQSSVVIAGWGSTEFSRGSGLSDLELSLRAITAALDDAGISPTDVDGLVTFDADLSDEVDVARMLGVSRLGFFSRTGYGGGGATATIGQAAMAIEAGAAQVVVVYRGLNRASSGRKWGRPSVTAKHHSNESRDLEVGWHAPFGLVTPAAGAALLARRYLHEASIPTELLGHVAVAARAFAATNPAAYFHGRPITLEDHAASKMIADPLRLLDCCLESDGGIAFVVTSEARASHLDAAHQVRVLAHAQALVPSDMRLHGYYSGSMTSSPGSRDVAAQLWERTDLSARDMQVAILYDHFTPFVLMQLVDYGFCSASELAPLVVDGGIGPGGELVVNPHGGQLGEAYIHGMNGIAEAVRQIRGIAANQVDSCERVLVTSGSRLPTGGLVLGAA